MFSQGAQLVHLAARQISSSVQNRVAAVVVFGDPDNGSGFPGVLNGRSITFCNVGDDICAGGDLILAPHLEYGAVSLYQRLVRTVADDFPQNAGDAAKFVNSHLWIVFVWLMKSHKCISVKENIYKNVFTWNSSNWDAMVLCFDTFRRSSNQADGEGIGHPIDKTNETVSATLEMELRRKSSPKRPIKPLFHESS